MSSLIAANIDFANHHANATRDDIRALCDTVTRYGFNSAFVNPCYIAWAKELLQGKAKVGTAFSFPLGQDALPVKVRAAQNAIEQGANELDIVPNIGAFVSGNADTFLSEMKTIVESVRTSTVPTTIVKFILDTGYIDLLTDPKEKLKEAARLVKAAGADFVKICSGMGPRGASVEDVMLVREAVGPDMNIKAAGGIDTFEEATALFNAGVNRIGTSHAVTIIEHNGSAPQNQTHPTVTE